MKKITETLPREVDNLPVESIFAPSGAVGPRLVPKIETTSPGDSEAFAKLAAFSTEVTTGGPNTTMVTGTTTVARVAGGTKKLTLPV